MVLISKKDLNNNDLSIKDFEMLLKDFGFNINNGKLGDKLISDGISSIYKIRFKDKKHNTGSSGGYRFIYILVVGGINLAIPFHLYSKHFGKKPKIDLTQNEKLQLKNIINEINKSLSKEVN